ncbi:porin PorA family protein [Rhodococcus sp. IEGM 1366]|uniref:porin PorA family protein n=1 Tax=Rhodococcus sp. IEGM 1366 TaxID=3082223 RepID=UPI002952CF0B|nr:porin PorA family protein [Rhodococcus sp. IEGM 1366]MDV8070683.1 porin PorA family protein [Rhodococcus sp. IEGM 1366]
MKTGKLLTAVLILFGILLIGGAAIIRFAVTPGLTNLSYESDGGGLYVGTLSTPNPDPAAAGSPITTAVDADVSTEIKSISGDTAIVETLSEMYASPRTSSDLEPIVVDRHTYAVDRQDYLQAPAPSGTAVEDQKSAITIGFPSDYEHRELSIYDSVTGEPQALAAAGTVEVDGRTLDKFTVDASAPVKDPAVLDPLRAGLGQQFGTDGTWVPKAALLALGLPAALVDLSPDQIPVAYVQQTAAEILVDQRFGTIVDTSRTSSNTANLEIPGQSVPIPLSETSLQASDELVTSTISKLNSAQTTLTFLSIWLPIAMLIVGVILLVGAFWNGTRKRGVSQEVPTPLSSVGL